MRALLIVVLLVQTPCQRLGLSVVTRQSPSLYSCVLSGCDAVLLSGWIVTTGLRNEMREELHRNNSYQVILCIRSYRELPNTAWRGSQSINACYLFILINATLLIYSTGKMPEFELITEKIIILTHHSIILSMSVDAWRESASKAEPGSSQWRLVTRRGNGHRLAGRGSPWTSGSTSVLLTVLPELFTSRWTWSWVPCSSLGVPAWARRCGQMDTEVPSHLSHSETCNHQYCWVHVSTGKVKKTALMLCEFKRFGGLYNPVGFPAHRLAVLSGCFPQGTVSQSPFLGLWLWICKQQPPVEAGKVPEIKHPIPLVKYSLWESLQMVLWLRVSRNCFLVVLHFLRQVNFKGNR